MWTLIVITTFWAQGTAEDASVYSFHTFNTEARCVQIKNWIDYREKYLEHNANRVKTQCVQEK